MNAQQVPPGTPPWETSEIDDTNVWAIYDAAGNLLADVYPVDLEPSGEARARLIVQAVNARGEGES